MADQPTGTPTTGAGGDAAKPSRENVWTATYEGSGNFIIHKPKRNRRKINQQRVHNRRRGMR
jgi:hypothetical protein